MQYIDSLKFDQLEVTHPEYKFLIDDWNLISELCKGGLYAQKNADNYLLVRDDEDQQIREKRKEKFFVRNHLASAIRTQRMKMATGNLYYPKEKALPGDINIWNYFFSNADGKGTEFKVLLLDCFEKALQYRTIFSIVDIPPVRVGATNTRQYELAEKALQQKGDLSIPYVITLEPQQVLNWGEGLKGLEWIKYKVVLEETSPFDEVKTSLMWVLIDDTHITVYGLDDIKLDDRGGIVEIKAGDNYKPFVREKDSIPVLYSQPHNRGAIPVERFEIPYPMWTTNQVMLVQKLLIGLDVNALHTTVNSGFVQKWMEPYFQSGNNAATIAPELMKQVMDTIAKSQGDESTLNVKSFNFAEMKGESIKVQFEVIDSLVTYIYNTIATTVASISKASLEQSGRSKEFDMYLAETSLMDYGALVVKFGQKLLRNVARGLGTQDIKQLEAISLTGFTEFKVKSLDESLERWGKAMTYDSLPLPPLLKKLIVQEVATSAARNATDQEIDNLNIQMDNLYTSKPQFESSAEIKLSKE